MEGGMNITGLALTPVTRIIEADAVAGTIVFLPACSILASA